MLKTAKYARARYIHSVAPCKSITGRRLFFLLYGVFMFRKSIKLATLPLFLFSTLAFAGKEHRIVAPHCLTQNTAIHYKNLASHSELHFFSIDESDIPLLIEKKHLQHTRCGGFMDVTDAWNRSKEKMDPNTFLNQYENKTTPHLKTTYTIRYPHEVKELSLAINPLEIWNQLTYFSGFLDRYANSDTGVKAANDLKSIVETMAKTYGHTDDVSAFLIPTGSFYQQPSVVAKFGNADEPGIVVGAHMDTLHGSTFNHKPGADDDGSGTTVVLEVARTLLASGYHFKKPIYFIWYAAEEEGLVGSQYVVDNFIQKNIPVSEVIHFDMTGYRHENDPTIWLYDDNTDSDLTGFLATLITTYIGAPIGHDRCGYACSDHATWTMNGFKAALPFEASFYTYNPYIHTSSDTMEKLSLNHMTNFALLGVAFAVELAEPVK